MEDATSFKPPRCLSFWRSVRTKAIQHPDYYDLHSIERQSFLCCAGAELRQRGRDWKRESDSRSETNCETEDRKSSAQGQDGVSNVCGGAGRAPKRDQF